MSKIARDNRIWLKVFPRNFNNEYYFIGFIDKEMAKKVMDNINNEPNSSCDRVQKRYVEKIEEFEEVGNYKGLFTLYGSDLGLENIVG